LTTKIHAIVDALGNPLAMSLTGGHVHDLTQAQILTQGIEPAALLADKGYDSDGFIEHLEVRRIKPVIPPRANRNTPREATSRSIASATSWNVSSTSSSTFAPSQPATKRPPETSSQASTSSAP
jgi:transposase